MRAWLGGVRGRVTARQTRRAATDAVESSRPARLLRNVLYQGNVKSGAPVLLYGMHLDRRHFLAFVKETAC